MRPQDVIILLKVISLNDQPWHIKDLAFSLSISASEVSVSLSRSHAAGLLDASKKKVSRQAFLLFIQYGLRYVFPQIPGSMVIGVPTAHSHPFYKSQILSEIDYVWPDNAGPIRGFAIQPLHSGVTKAVAQDPILYKLLASIDILRVGRNREVGLAIEELKKHILL
ncbi:hypothetical protein GFS24_16930 [Chitinophaga sp. SYP-B3965]|nr:hypothetical protein [Chitinophaga sp. SYP-B3965]